MGTIQEDIQTILKKIDEQEDKKKQRPFRLPFGSKVGKSQQKKNFVTVMIINENGHIDFKKYMIEDQTVLHDTLPRLAGAGHVMYYKKNPMIILPNWSVKPFSPMDNYQDSLKDGSNKIGYKLLMAKIEGAAIKGKVKMGGMVKWIVGLGLAAIIGYALMTGGGAV